MKRFLLGAIRKTLYFAVFTVATIAISFLFKDAKRGNEPMGRDEQRYTLLPGDLVTIPTIYADAPAPDGIVVGTDCDAGGGGGAGGGDC